MLYAAPGTWVGKGTVFRTSAPTGADVGWNKRLKGGREKLMRWAGVIMRMIAVSSMRC